MALDGGSLDWSIQFISRHADGDLFPKMPEMEALVSKKVKFIKLLTSEQISNHTPGPCRRFLVPKDDVSYRQATQLDLQDSIILTALVHQFGQGIEAKRLPSDTVFSYRFNPTLEDGLYSNKNAWNDFWKKASDLSYSCSNVLYCDIADFYNQIYHHTVENQLISCGFPNQETKWIISLLASTTAGVSRGVPIGPHAVHLIAESTMIPIDNTLQSYGLTFVRYADDIIVFCKDKAACDKSLAIIANVLDTQQRLMLQRHKTKILKSKKFRTICDDMVEDHPINAEEASLLAIIKKYSKGDPYKVITYDQVSADDWRSISQDAVTKVIKEYIAKKSVDYIRLRWFYRRLSQIGHPGAIEVSLEKLESLGPCFANICFYLASVQSIEPKDWNAMGSSVLKLLDNEKVKLHQYFRLLILSLFSRNAFINHFPILSNLFQAADASARREILLAAKINNATDWIRSHKETFQSMDPWQRMAYLYCVSGLPADEKKHFIKRWKYARPVELILAKWSEDLR